MRSAADVQSALAAYGSANTGLSVYANRPATRHFVWRVLKRVEATWKKMSKVHYLEHLMERSGAHNHPSSRREWTAAAAKELAPWRVGKDGWRTGGLNQLAVDQLGFFNVSAGGSRTRTLAMPKEAHNVTMCSVDLYTASIPYIQPTDDDHRAFEPSEPSLCEQIGRLGASAGPIALHFHGTKAVKQLMLRVFECWRRRLKKKKHSR